MNNTQFLLHPRPLSWYPGWIRVRTGRGQFPQTNRYTMS